MRWLMRFLPLLIVTYALCIAGAVVVGRAQPLPEHIAQFKLTECAPPCWIGIEPGKTTLAEALARVRAVYSAENHLYTQVPSINIINNRLDLSFSIAFEVDNTNVVQVIDIWQYGGNDIPFSSFFSVLGPPQYVTILPTRSYYTTSLIYNDYSLAVVLENNVSAKIGATRPINRIMMTEPAYAQRYRLYEPLPWQGLRAYWVILRIVN